MAKIERENIGSKNHKISVYCSFKLTSTCEINLSFYSVSCDLFCEYQNRMVKNIFCGVAKTFLFFLLVKDFICFPGLGLDRSYDFVSCIFFCDVRLFLLTVYTVSNVVNNYYPTSKLYCLIVLENYYLLQSGFSTIYLKPNKKKKEKKTLHTLICIDKIFDQYVHK